MCRSIKTLRRPSELPTKVELEAAALQFVRKISGYRHPSKSRQKAFDRAVRSVASAAEKLFQDLHQEQKVPTELVRKREVLESP